MTDPTITRDYVEDLANVRGTASRPDGTLLVFVSKKIPERDLDDDDIVPKTLDQTDPEADPLTTDVIEAHIPHLFGGDASADATVQLGETHRERRRPVEGGISIGPDRRSAGTGGYVGFVDRDGDDVLLTNQHVGAADGRESDKIFQPAILDGGDVGDVIGHLKEATEPTTDAVNRSDSALIRVDPEEMKPQIHGIGEPVDFGEATFDVTYLKSGRTTGVTDGSLLGRDGRFRITSGPDTLPYEGLDVFTDMSMPGDSGSLIGYLTPLGFIITTLLFAGSDTITLGIPISTVMDVHGPLTLRKTEEPEPDPEPEPDTPSNGGDLPDPLAFGQFRYQARLEDIAKVVDGDTFNVTLDLGFRMHFSDQRIRLLDVDTAERGDPLWHEHKQFTTEWLLAAAEQHDGEWPLVVDTVKDGKGSFGRWLANVYRKSDGKSISESIIEEYGDDYRYEAELFDY